jgi:hypothetical protein
VTSGATKLRTVRAAGFTLIEGIHAGGSALPWHHHEGPTLCFVLRGAFTETSGGERLTCTPDTLKVMPAGERHCDEFDHGDARGLLVETDAERARSSYIYFNFTKPKVMRNLCTISGRHLGSIRRIFL